MSAVLAQNNPDADGHSPLASVFALCPVVNLYETLEDVLRPSTKGLVMSRGAWKVVQNLYRVRGEEIPNERPSIRDFLDIVALEGQKKYESFFAQPYFVFKPFENIHFQTANEFWRVNRFMRYADSTQVPTFAWTAYDDPLVPTEKNALMLMNQTNHLTSANIRTYIVPNGRHCAEAMVYGWSTTTEIYKSFFLNFDDEFNKQAHETIKPLPSVEMPEQLKRLNSHEFHFAQTWAIEKGSSNFQLTFQIWSPNSKFECEKLGPYTASIMCFRTQTINVPLALITEESHVRVPQTDVEAQALTRWANTNISVFGSDNEELNHSKATPADFRWTQY
jgi:hypothetical protein